MKKLKLYLDTTVWNYPFETHSPQRTADTLELFRLVRMGLHEVFYSELVLAEIEATRTARREWMLDLMREITPKELKPLMEIKDLASEYIKRKALPKRRRADAEHVAYSTVYQMDALVSWNYQDLANVSRWKRVIEVNFERGYNFPIQLVTPLEVLGHDKKSI